MKKEMGPIRTFIYGLGVVASFILTWGALVAIFLGVVLILPFVLPFLIGALIVMLIIVAVLALVYAIYSIGKHA